MGRIHIDNNFIAFQLFPIFPTILTYPSTSNHKTKLKPPNIYHIILSKTFSTSLLFISFSLHQYPISHITIFRLYQNHASVYCIKL